MIFCETITANLNPLHLWRIFIATRSLTIKIFGDCYIEFSPNATATREKEQATAFATSGKIEKSTASNNKISGTFSWRQRISEIIGNGTASTCWQRVLGFVRKLSADSYHSDRKKSKIFITKFNNCWNNTLEV